MKAIVLAAGKGVRLWPLTEKRPKPLLPVAGKSLVARTVESLARARVEEIVVTVNYKEEMLREALGDRTASGSDVSYVKQETPKGTADAVLTCKKSLEGEDRFLVVYGDDYYSKAGIDRLAEAAGTKESDMLVGAARVKDTSEFGRLSMKDGLVESIVEKNESNTAGMVNAGIYLFDESIFKAAAETKPSARGEYELTDSVELLIRQGSRVGAVPLEDGEWLGVSHPWNLLDANSLALESEEMRMEGTVEPNVRMKGRVVMAKGSLIKSGSYVEGPVFVGEDAHLGPNCFIRPYVSVGRGARVGAACEVKNSILMEGATVPHLSYVGDSILGVNCSFGAGTITANLRFDDGTVKSLVKNVLVDSRRRKLGAVIGDDARTGINVSLLPGVKVGADAWIGPGAIVSEDVPSGGRVKGPGETRIEPRKRHG